MQSDKSDNMDTDLTQQAMDAEGNNISNVVPETEALNNLLRAYGEILPAHEVQFLTSNSNRRDTNVPDNVNSKSDLNVDSLLDKTEYVESLQKVIQQSEFHFLDNLVNELEASEQDTTDLTNTHDNDLLLPKYGSPDLSQHEVDKTLLVQKASPDSSQILNNDAHLEPVNFPLLQFSIRHPRNDEILIFQNKNMILVMQQMVK